MVFMTFLRIAYAMEAQHKCEQEQARLRRKERWATSYSGKPLRKELEKAYEIKPRGKLPPLKEAADSLDSRIGDMEAGYNLFFVSGESTSTNGEINQEVIEYTPDDILIKMKGYLDNAVISLKNIMEYNSKRSYQDKLPRLRKAASLSKNYAYLLSNEIDIYLREENPTNLRQTKIIQFIKNGIEQLINKYNGEIGKYLPVSNNGSENLPPNRKQLVSS